jgi:hypothetical protein
MKEKFKIRFKNKLDNEEEKKRSKAKGRVEANVEENTFESGVYRGECLIRPSGKEHGRKKMKPRDERNVNRIDYAVLCACCAL